MANAIGLKGQELALTEIRSDLVKLRLRKTDTSIVDTITLAAPLTDFNIAVSAKVELVNAIQIDFTVSTAGGSASYVEYLDASDGILLARTLNVPFLLLSTEGIVSFAIGALTAEI